jgi:hypothetical protein
MQIVRFKDMLMKTQILPHVERQLPKFWLSLLLHLFRDLDNTKGQK